MSGLIAFSAPLALILGLLVDRRRRRDAAAQEHNGDGGPGTLERNRDLAGRLIASQELERTRIARDLHDGVCQEIAAVSVDLSHLRQTKGDLQSAAVQERILSIQHRTAALAENIRRLSHGLHPSVLQHIGLVAALQSHCAEIERQHHVHVTLCAEGEIEPSSHSVALSLFRIVQEALANAARHGHARHATVSLTRMNGDLALCVVDDGGGFDMSAARPTGGLGLVSMEERARFARGRVSIWSQPGSGTVVDVRIPAAVAGAACSPDPMQQPWNLAEAAVY